MNQNNVSDKIKLAISEGKVPYGISLDYWIDILVEYPNVSHIEGTQLYKDNINYMASICKMNLKEFLKMFKDKEIYIQQICDIRNTERTEIRSIII